MNYRRLSKDGKVAILYSPRFGAGWSSWNHDEACKEMLFDPEIAVALLEKRAAQEIKQLALEKWPDACLLGIDDLEIAWVPQGARFRINEYDGSESVVLDSEDDWQVA